MNGWQKIETAPKDGTRILIHTRMGSITAQWKDGWWVPYIDNWTKAEGGDDWVGPDETHVTGTYLVMAPVEWWMHLPPDPES
jgi:hypothetical protein